MSRLHLFLILVIVLAACNLSNEPQREPPTDTAAPPTAEALPTPALTPLASSMPGASGPESGIPIVTTSQANTPVANSTPLGTTCAVYTTYSGVDAANVLSMRAEPSAGSAQVLRVPNNARVFLVPGAQEVEAEGYHWLNVIYVDLSQNRYVGWIARDSFLSGGVRDPSIATLRVTGERAPC